MCGCRGQPDSEPCTYNNDELRAILAAARNESEERVFFLLAFAGLRLTEAASLEWRQIDFANHQIKLVGKAGKFRLVPLHPMLDALLRDHQARVSPEQPHLVESNRGRQLSHRSWHDLVRSMVDRAGIETHAPAHTFRKTVATVMREQGVRTEVVDRIMGWAPRTVRDRHYVRVADEAMHQAIRTLYQDDPIYRPQEPEEPPAAAKPAEVPAALAKYTDRLARLEHDLGLS